MGGRLSQNAQPEELAVFKKLPANTPPENIQIPESPENRRPTDRICLCTFIIIVILLFPSLIYTMINGDLARFRWYDKCGNICGQKNTEYSQWSCTGQDFTDKPFLQVEETRDSMRKKEAALVERKCVEKCDLGYKQVLYTCYRPENSSGSSKNLSSSKYSEFNRHKRETTDSDINEDDNTVTEYLNKHAWIIVSATFISLGVAIIMLVLFITATTCVVWIIVGVVPVLFGLMVAGLIYEWSSVTKKIDKEYIIYFAICLTSISLGLFIVIVFMFKKLRLVIQLLRESTKAAFAMPLLIFVPIITFFAHLIIIGLLIFTNIWMYTSGTLSEIKPGYLEYKSNAVMIFTFFFNAVVAWWSRQLVIGIEQMTIAGAVATWYWSKTKNNLDSPISRSAKIVFRFHLGSIAFGSLIVAFVAIIKVIIISFSKKKYTKACIEIFMASIETFLKFLSKNSFIITALHGTPFYKSGKRAATIIYQNLENIIVINYVGDFVLAMVATPIVIISVFITAVIMFEEDGKGIWLVCWIVFIVSFFIAQASVAIFETTIDTIFICFCEDSLLNDGKARPYAMSRELMEFIENSKKLYGK